MALKLWMGPSGSGKTRFLFEYVLKEAAKHHERNYIVIVPEQFTLSTQRELIRLSKDRGILNVDVLSFARLAYRIFEEVGFKNARGADIDDMGKNLILRHLATKCEEELTVLNGNMDKLGYISEVKSAISEFMQYGIDVNKVHELSLSAGEAGRSQLAAKLHDVEILYRSFNEYTNEKFITKEEILSKASRVVFNSGKIKKSVVVFDGFTGFTPVQYDFIESLMKIAYDIHVTILTDTRDIANNITYNTEHELFYLGYKTSEKLKKLAELNNIPIEKDIIIDEEIPRRFLLNDDVKGKLIVTDEQLVHLERNLFREYGKAFKSENRITGKSKLPTKTVNSGIRVFSGLQPIDEVTKVAVEIEKLIRNKNFSTSVDRINNGIDDAREYGSKINNGIKYKNIAIVTGDQETYIPIVRRVFAEYNIPFFIDKTQPVLLNPFIEFVRALSDVITENFTYSAVFRYLRSPLSGLDKNDIDRLENFILKYGIKGVDNWQSNWIEKYSRYFKNDMVSGEIVVNDNLLLYENLRMEIMKKLECVVDLITASDSKDKKKSTKAVNEINTVFMRVFEELEVENRIKMLAEEYSITDDSFENSHKKEYEKIYGLVIELMLRMEKLLPDEKISVDEYGELLDAGFDEIRIGTIPTITDYIQIGDITRSRFDDIHTLFIVGANDGVIPKNNGGGGILSDIEKEFLLDSTPDIELSPTSREKAYTSQLYLYMLMTKPKKQLVLSYSRLSSESESIKPSYIIKVVTDMFPDIEIEKDFESDFDRVYNLRTGYNVAAEHIREEEYEVLLKTISKEFEGYKDRFGKLVDAAFVTGVMNGSDEISRAVAEVLYGKAIIGSVTRLEQYARCSFSYFLKYGLSLKERELFSFEAKDMGSIFHSVLEKYSGYISRMNLSWTGISDEEMHRLVIRAVKECIDDPEYAVLVSSSRYKYMIERISRISLRSVSVLTEHLRAGQFIPRDAEISFSSSDRLDAFTFKLSDDEVMKLTGKIDRLDTYEDTENNRVYIKVIDYKSGNKSLDLVEVYRGLSLQLVVYMNAAMELTKAVPDYSGKEIIPAGILYYHIDDPIVEGKQGDSDEEISGRILKELKMKGLVNSDKEVYELMDSTFDKESDIIPVSVKKDGSLSQKNTSAVSAGDFNVISSFVNKKICEIGREILSGDIKAEPHSKNGVDGTSCAFCQYTDICKFDGFYEDEGEDISKDNVLDLMREAVGSFIDETIREEGVQ